MNPFKGRHFQRDIILWAVRWYWRNPSDLCPWHMDETYVKVNGRWAYLYRAVDSRGRTVDFYLSSR
ncbi:DDE-type integrase/transposase/recombinase, partial [Klebsiella aerogenes]